MVQPARPVYGDIGLLATKLTGSIDAGACVQRTVVKESIEDWAIIPDAKYGTRKARRTVRKLWIHGVNVVWGNGAEKVDVVFSVKLFDFICRRSTRDVIIHGRVHAIGHDQC